MLCLVCVISGVGLLFLLVTLYVVYSLLFVVVGCLRCDVAVLCWFLR